MSNLLPAEQPQNMQLTHSYSASVELTKPQKALANELRGLSLAVNPSFPIPNIMLAEYAIILEDEHPNLTPAILKKIIRQIQTGKLPYDQNKGVRALFEAIEKYKELRTQYQLFNINNGETQIMTEDGDFSGFDANLWFVCRVRRNGVYNASNEIPPLIDGLQFIDDRIKREREDHLRAVSKGHTSLQAFNKWIKTINNN